METVADLQSEWARLVIGTLVRAGVRHAVISPGSRSTPFVLAALDHPNLRTWVALDERSGAHFALGQARATQRPSLVLCTSGSAPANYFPAVIEADEGRIPLVVMSADRPPELQGVGANQATDQMHLYGKHARFFANLGEASGGLRALQEVSRAASDAVAHALGPTPGPVQLNAEARKPLERAPASGAEAEAVHKRVDTLLEGVETPQPATRLPTVAAVDEIAKALDLAKRPVILCGPAHVAQGETSTAVAELAIRSGALLLAESSSQLRFGPTGEVALGSFDALWSSEEGRARLAPDFVLQLGASPVSKGWEHLSHSNAAERFVVHPSVWADPSKNARAVFQADVAPTVEALLDRAYDLGRRELGFAKRFRAADERCWQCVKSVLQDGADALTEGAVAPAVLDSAPAGSALVLGNSLPIRHVDRWAAPQLKPLRVYTQRGVSGIDGVTSAAAGVASCSDTATTLIVGDVGFLHDLNGLQLASGLSRPLVVVVINNRGGRIFEQLPVAALDEDALRYFTTPHEAQLASAAAVYGCRHVAPDDVPGLRQALGDAYRYGGCTVVEARVPPDSARVQGQALASKLRSMWRDGGV